MHEISPEMVREVFRSFVQSDDLRVTKSRGNVNGIYLDARAADMLEAYGIKAKYMPPEVRHRIHGDFDFGSHNYSLDTRIANQWSDEPGEKGWNLDVIDGAQHVPLTEKGAQKLAVMGASSTLNPTPVDASVDHVRMAMGPGGAIY